MPLTIRRKGSISSMLSRKSHRRSASESSIGDVTKDNASTSQSRNTLAPLTTLSEQDRVPSPRRPPPSAFRGVRPAPPSPNMKGKERATAAPLQQRPGRAHWIVDSLESQRGAEVWKKQDRVILVVGEPSRAALAPLLYSPSFADTLVLVGSVDPIPEIEVLNSPSHLLHSDTIYPTVQPYQPPASAISDVAHPITAVLQYGAAIAEAHRRELSGTPTLPRNGSFGSFGPRSRRGSQSSLSGSQTPPGTPRRKRMFSFGQGSASEGASPPVSRQNSMLDLARLASAAKEGSSRGSSRTPSLHEGNDRPTLHKRMSSLFRNDTIVSDGSPFDAVINFIPFANPGADQQRVLQQMLQSTVVLTTCAMPMLATSVTASSANAQLAISELAPLSLIHIVPVDAPLQLPTVIEKFLLPLMPTMAGRIRRPLFGVVTGYGAWLNNNTDPAHDGYSGAETLLFGGVRCPMTIAAAEGVKPQAMLAGWDHCCISPGLLVEMAESRQTPPTFSRQASHMALSDMRTLSSARANSSVNSSQSTTSMTTASMASPSPPSSPSMGVAALPAGAAPARSVSPTARRTTSPVKEPRAEIKPSASSTVKAKSSSPPRANELTMRAKPSTLPRPTSDTYGAKTPTPVEHIRPESATPRGTTAPSSPAEAQFISRFDPRYREMEARREANGQEFTRAQAKEALRSTLPSSRGSSNLSAYSKTAPRLPNGAAPPAEFGGHEKRASHGPSGLRNAVTMPRQQALQPSPPTPELDPSSSSCSSSSVLEPNWSEGGSGGSAGSSKRSSSAPVPLPSSKSMPGSMNRKGGLTGFTSIFRRRGVKA